MIRLEIHVSDRERLTVEQIKDLGLSVDEEGYPYSQDEDEYVHSYIEFSTIDDLSDFISKYGRVIITKDCIEIYNGYRE